VALLDVGNGPAAGVDGGEEVAHVGAGGGSGVELDVFSPMSSGYWSRFIDDVFVDRRLILARGIEVVAHDAGLEHSLSP